MKKQSDMHSPHRVPESEKEITTFPAPAFTTSKPRGVQDLAHAAERNVDRNVSGRAGKSTVRSSSRRTG